MKCTMEKERSITHPDFSKCPICSAISKENMEELYRSMKYKISGYTRGEVIARQGDICKHLYILIKGAVKTEMVTDTGGLLTIENIEAVRPLASAFLFAEDNRFPVDVTATEESVVLTIPKEEVIKLFQKDAGFLERYIMYNSNKTQFLSNKLQVVTIKTIKAKLAHYLLEQLNICHTVSPSVNTFQMDKNQTELAKFFGVTRPALARTLSELAQDGLIATERNKITVLKKQALQNLLG
ncbi:MAG: Crp/Fnr family transcriptional regulator [Bacteroidales bacterium]|nr:Crp/Fnr family transcriptional regulator [Bacteroidales bacterium]